jgi:spermidine synthase
MLTICRGLGVGTTPGALIAHGIDTTVVEIDPAVHDFASKYFQLPKNHTAVIEDAVSYTDRLASVTENGRFDYIIHDVFTGGAEPIALFTLEFLQNLYTLLKPGGVVAIVSRYAQLQRRLLTFKTELRG